ncbi:MAG: PLP-dependent aminotransferase family protein [Ilumatobacter sp.]
MHLDLQLQLPAGTGRRVALESTLREAIRSGRLDADSSLPSSRSLAADLGVSRSTVVAAYEQLTAEGYLESAHGSGTRVAASRRRAPAALDVDLFGPAPAHDFRPGEPDASSFPRARWLRSVRRVLDGAPDAALGYPDPRGIAELRETIAGYIRRTRTVDTDRAGVRITGGYGAGLGLLAETFRRRGMTRIGVEDPTLPIYTQLLRSVGLRTVPIQVGDEGIDLDQLAEADVGAVVVTPAHQFPTGVTMSPTRRSELVEWARRADTWIVEDDYDGEYRHDRRPIGALQGLAPDRVIYAGTASKSLSPALRLGWLVVPSELRDDLLRVSNVRSAVSAIDQLVLADFIDRGEFDRHVRKMRFVYGRRSTELRAMLADAAPWLRLGDGSAGLHLTGVLDRDAPRETEVLAACTAGSVGVLGLVTDLGASVAGPGLAIGFSRPSQHHFPTALTEFADALATL